jgi:hypothetical protein
MSLLNNVFGSPGIGAATNAAQGLIGQSYQDQLAQQYTNGLAQSMIGTQQAIAGGLYQRAMKPFNPNEQPAYQSSMSNLVTLWNAKYGDTWVEKFDEDFWIDAVARLNAVGKLEKAGGWYRIKEDA